MFIGEEKKTTLSERTSKLGKKHKCKRIQTLYIFKCDSCSEKFIRPRGSIEVKRLTDFYKHVCAKCDPKKFAQQQGVKQRKLLDMPVSSTKRVSDF